MTTTQENPMRLTRHVADALRVAHDRALIDLENARGSVARAERELATATTWQAEAQARQTELAAALDAHRDAITRGEVDMRALHAAGIASETAAARTAPFADFED